jgi:hypothetical protein
LKQELEAKLSVNKEEIDMNEFVESLVAHVTVGTVKSLKGVDYIKTIDVNMDKGEVDISVNNENIPLTPFPNDIIASTLIGLVSSLKGIDEVDKMKIRVDAK